MTTPLGALLASAPSLAALRGYLEKASHSDAAILILGEPGTGRTRLARALHASSPRAAQSVVEVDPGVIPSSLFESEFFGYRPGAFTGADQAMAGRVERAESGTLILDHVEEIPLSAQPKLLRLLAERRFSPLGGEEREIDVRFIAIGSDELPARVKRGAFREDLYYRLEVLAFQLEPLRDRPGDLPFVIEDMLEDLRERYVRPGVELTPRAREWMLAYAWPGNLRQLRNVLERAIVLGDNHALDPPAPVDSGDARPRSLREMEQEAIATALAHTRGHQGRAAKILGISRKALWEKRRRYGIP